MDSPSDLENLKDLQRDLTAFSEKRLPNINRLWEDLEANIEEFRHLLDKPRQNEINRKSLKTGRVSIHRAEYSVNEEFQEQAIQLSDFLELDELRCAQLLLESEAESIRIVRPVLFTAISRFHEDRIARLECIRMVGQQAIDAELNEGLREPLKLILSHILETEGGPARNGSLFAQKCAATMADIERWLQRLADITQRMQTIGQATHLDLEEIVVIQQGSLKRQHESLSAIYTQLVKGNYTGVEDFHKLLEYMPTIERWTSPAIHYVPMLMSLCSQYGSLEGAATLREARAINQRFLHGREHKRWHLTQFEAACTVWWLAEYSGWYYDQPITSPLQGVDLQAEATRRNDAFEKALEDGALHFSLSISSQIRPPDWRDPARQKLTELLHDLQISYNDSIPSSGYFQDLVMEQLEIFTEAFITNMPDTLRRFKAEEDDQRRKLHSGVVLEQAGGAPEADLHLERFLVIMSYAFEQRPEAAEVFWSDTGSNFYGFLQWASKRQATPRVGAFCEMFRSISEGAENAEAAHRFLLEDTSGPTNRLRRSSALSWAQIFEELNFYAISIRGTSNAPVNSSSNVVRVKPIDIDEPESGIMLECYLRLMTHLCFQSEPVRQYILSPHETTNILETLFLLCGTSVPASLRACTFNTIESLLTDKSIELSHTIWTLLDQWACSPYPAPLQGQGASRSSLTAGRAEGLRFEAVANSFQEANAFVALLTALIRPPLLDTEFNDILPFPEQLGSRYRMPGIQPYVDLVLEKIFALQVLQQTDPFILQTLSWRCLDFTVTCLATFNEDLLLLANNSHFTLDEAMSTSSLLVYICLHPFHRVMDWIFNDRVVSALFLAAHQDIDVVNASTADSPISLALSRSLEVMNRVLDMQATYLDIVRPKVKLETSTPKNLVSNPTLVSFEESVASHLGLIVDLGHYIGSGHDQIVLASVNLLSRLASSRKLNGTPTMLTSSTRGPGNRLIGALTKDNEIDITARSLITCMEFDEREILQGPVCPEYEVKVAVLEFLYRALAADPNRPNLVHALLGLKCMPNSVEVGDKSPFSEGQSLFHVLVEFSKTYPESLEDMFLNWCLRLKELAFRILELLWGSSLTSSIVLDQLRGTEFLPIHFLRQVPLDPTILWDGDVLESGNHLLDPVGSPFEHFVRQRKSLFQYATAELRYAINEQSTSAQKFAGGVLLGSVSNLNGEVTSCLSIMDMLDFLALSDTVALPPIKVYFFGGLDFDAAVTVNGDIPLFRMEIVEQQLALRRNEMQKSELLTDPAIAEALVNEQTSIFAHFLAVNNQRRISAACLSALQSWGDLVAQLISDDTFPADVKSSFALRVTQLCAPKLEAYILPAQPEALILARTIEGSFYHLNLAEPSEDTPRVSEVVLDRMFQLFRLCLRAVNDPSGCNELRESLYGVCSTYIRKLRHVDEGGARRNGSLQAIKHTGQGVIETLSDDSEAAEGSCRIAAVLLLDELVSLAKDEKSAFIIDSLDRINFIVTLVESVQHMSEELQTSDEKDLDILFAWYQSKLNLMLAISQTKLGASALMSADFFSALRASRLFTGDPDLGLDVDNPKALQRYHILLLGFVKIVASLMLSQGPQNDRTIEQTRSFLVEYRPSVLATFKRQAKVIQSKFQMDSFVVDDLVDLSKIKGI
ncbi:hypothetical protein MMC25_003752 [Agyrium rufum]|nr:hypothetical protein [Agyrium rufum]